jgi:hypothetical protein
MSVVSEANVQCETIQLELDTQFATCNPVLDPMPALEAILATQRAAGITQSVSDGNGKVKTVKVTYDQRALESAASETTGARTCTSTNETYNNYTTYDIDPNTHIVYGEKIDIGDLATVCQDFNSFYAKKIAKVIDVIERKVATKVAGALVTNYGVWGSAVGSGSTVGTYNGSDELIVATLVSAATKVIDYSGMSEIDLALMQTGYCQAPIIVGGSALYQYGQWINKGCCSTTGVNVLDMANEFGKAILYDKRVATALGSENKSIVFQPGAVALLTYNEFNETNIVSGSNYAKFKVFSPRTGLPIDIIIKDDCGTISITGYATVELVGLPADMFAVGDEFRGVKFVNKILVTNPA